jgi:single-strand DNA-binding protein
MANNNTITIVGNVTREPELRFTANGRSQLTLGLAVNHRYPDRNRPGEWIEDTSFFNVVCWTDLAENVSASVQKGSRIIVMGRLSQRSWETDNNEKRSVVEVIAEEVGPSLRWATAQISRTERKGPGEGARSGAAANVPAGAAAGTTGGGGYDDFGEEPF